MKKCANSTCENEAIGRKKYCCQKCRTAQWDSEHREQRKESWKRYRKNHPEKFKRNHVGKKILCGDCEVPLFATGPSHKFCDTCRKQRDIENRKKWAAKNDTKELSRKYYLLNKDKFKYRPKEKQFFTCQCGEVLEKKSNRKYCPECLKKRKRESAARFARNNPDKIKARRKGYKIRKKTKAESKAHYQKYKLKINQDDFRKRIMLDDSYIKKSLIHFGITSEFVTKEMIEQKRAALRITRIIRDLKQTKQ